jgi:hypothetical protein
MQHIRRNYAAEAAKNGAWRTFYAMSVFLPAFVLTCNDHTVWLWSAIISVFTSFYFYLSAGHDLITVGVNGDEVRYRVKDTSEVRVDNYRDIRAAACFNSAYISFGMGACALVFVALWNAHR